MKEALIKQIRDKFGTRSFSDFGEHSSDFKIEAVNKDYMTTVYNHNGFIETLNGGGIIASRLLDYTYTYIVYAKQSKDHHKGIMDWYMLRLCVFKFSVENDDFMNNTFTIKYIYDQTL